MSNFLHKYRIISTLFIVWAMVMVTVAICFTFINPPDIPLGTVTALGSVLGLPAVAVGLYQWRNKSDP